MIMARLTIMGGQTCGGVPLFTVASVKKFQFQLNKLFPNGYNSKCNTFYYFDVVF